MIVRCVWFREDLRVEDNLALSYAAESGPVWGLFLVTPAWWDRHYWGNNKKAVIFKALQALAQDLKKLNIPLIIKEVSGSSGLAQVEQVLSCLKENTTTQVYFNRQYEIHETDRDLLLTQHLKKYQMDFYAFDDQLLFPPRILRTLNKQPFTVFTPFKKKALASLDIMIMKAPQVKAQAPIHIQDSLSSLALHQSDSDLTHLPITPVEVEKRLRFFAEHHLASYHIDRDYPVLDGTSKLSAALSAGTISIREIWRLIDACPPSKGRDMYCSELLWREFYKHVLIDFPHVCRSKAFKKEYDDFQWIHDLGLFERWQLGQTGYPLVDAGMRQLRQEGWMHNRLRMVCAVFLSKLLLISWQEGEQEFARWLADYDLSANNGGWQWSASTGTDAAPYFRILSPWAQTERFDSEAHYIKRYVPELRHIDPADLFCPEKFQRVAPPSYPSFCVDYQQARERCLVAFKKNEPSE
jgi:deoxyribodipyrimidine photo-lyase